MGGFVQAILQSKTFKQRELFKQRKINAIYKDYLAGKKSNGTFLWKVMAIEIWLRVFVDDFSV
jgi:hypothetical protein